MSHHNPSSRIAWITGASSGIGRATALRLAGDGWQVALTARSEDKLKEIAETNDKLHVFAGDVTKPKKMTEIVEQIEKDLGPLHLVILNAGTYFPDSAEDLKAAAFKKIYEVNVFGAVNALEPALAKMKERGQGHIAIMASVAGYRGLPRSLAYGSSKAALNNFTEALAGELRGTGIKVQVINPGFVKTPLTDKNDFPMPMRIEVDEAAEKLVNGLNSSRFEINFPWLFCFLLKFFGRITPNKLYIWVLSKMKDRIRQDVKK